MKKSQLRKLNLTFLCCCHFAFCFAQSTFKYQSAIKKVSANGLYKIFLSPEVLARCESDLADLRLTDSKGKFIPYAKTVDLAGDSQSFLAFPKSTTKKDMLTSATVKNLSVEPISILWLKLKNAAVKRSVDLMGSDDQITWFAIKESIPLTEATETQSSCYLQSITFPSSNYRYFKIKVINKNKSPLNILEVGIYQDRISSLRLEKLPTPAITKIDSSNNITYIDLRFSINYRVDKLHFIIDAPKYFKRKVSIYEISNIGRSRIYQTEFVSGSLNNLSLPIRTRTLRFEIANDDNKPLRISGIEAFQNSTSVIAYLEAGGIYKFIFGDPKGKSPIYDLGFFILKNPQVLPEISTSSVSKNTGYHAKISANKPNYRLLMWAGMALAILILSLLTFKMVKEINYKK